MKTPQSFEDFENALKNENTLLQNTENIKSYVYSEQPKVKKYRKYSFSFKTVAVFLVLFIFTAGIASFANSKIIQLKNKKGEPIFESEVTSDDFLNNTPNYYLLYEKQIEEESHKYEPGEVFHLFTYNQDGGIEVVPYEKPKICSNIEQVKELTPKNFKFPEMLPDGYSFEKAYVFYRCDYPGVNEEIKEKLDEAIKDGKNYYFEKSKLPLKLGSVVINYKQDNKGGNLLYVSADYALSVIVPYDTASAEKIESGGMEFIYMDRNDPEDMDFIYFAEEDETENRTIAYEIGFYNNKMSGLTKEDVIEFAKSFK